MASTNNQADMEDFDSSLEEIKEDGGPPHTQAAVKKSAQIKNQASKSIKKSPIPKDALCQVSE